jgi:hypothetical protein
VFSQHKHLQLHIESVPIATNVASSNPTHDEVYSIQRYVIKCVIDLRQVGGFLRVSFTNKTDPHDIPEELLKLTLNHHKPHPKSHFLQSLIMRSKHWMVYNN